MKVKHIKNAGKGSQRILPGRGALNDLVKRSPSVVTYARAAPDVVRSGSSIAGKRP